MACPTFCKSAADNLPTMFVKRNLLKVVNWSAIALLCFPFSITYASPGNSLSMFEVSGTTCKRFKCLFDASLLTITGGTLLFNLAANRRRIEFHPPVFTAFHLLRLPGSRPPTQEPPLPAPRQEPFRGRPLQGWI